MAIKTIKKGTWADRRFKENKPLPRKPKEKSQVENKPAKPLTKQ